MATKLCVGKPQVDENETHIWVERAADGMIEIRARRSDSQISTVVAFFSQNIDLTLCRHLPDNLGFHLDKRQGNCIKIERSDFSMD